MMNKTLVASLLSLAGAVALAADDAPSPAGGAFSVCAGACALLESAPIASLGG